MGRMGYHNYVREAPKSKKQRRGATGPRNWPRFHTAETTAMTTHVVSLRPLILSTRPAPPECWQCSCLEAPNHSVTRQY